MRRSAYYSRNESYSRSYNAECAEAAGRLPKTRAAAHLGLSVTAFTVGCVAANYHSTEWHHVGKYAVAVDYYDTNELSASGDFWRGAAAHYVSKSKKAELLSKAAAADSAPRVEFAEKLAKQRDCSRQVQRHDGRKNWAKLVCQRCGWGKSWSYRLNTVLARVPVGDFDALSYWKIATAVNNALKQEVA